MNSKIISTGILRAIAIIIGVALLGYFLLMIQSVLVYIIIAAIIALIARPIILFLRRKLKFPNTIAVVTTMVVFLMLLVGIIGMFIPLVIEQGENLSLLQTDKLQTDVQNIIIEIKNNPIIQYFIFNFIYIYYRKVKKLIQLYEKYFK